MKFNEKLKTSRCKFLPPFSTKLNFHILFFWAKWKIVIHANPVNEKRLKKLKNGKASTDISAELVKVTALESL